MDFLYISVCVHLSLFCLEVLHYSNASLCFSLFHNVIFVLDTFNFFSITCESYHGVRASVNITYSIQ
jgi:hypothetical protein